jgi:hypothetical protein
MDLIRDIKNMNTFNVELKNGKQLSIPAEYYPRYAHIVAIKENLFCLTPINRLEAFFKTIACCIFNPTFAVLSIVNLGLCAPILVADHSENQNEVYYFFLSMGFIISYCITRFYVGFIKKDSLSLDGMAQQLGYSSFTHQLKPYDERMLKEIIHLNKLKGYRASLFFDDLYGILFDTGTLRRINDIYRPSHLRIIK